MNTNTFVVVTAFDKGSDIIDDERLMTLFLRLERNPGSDTVVSASGWISKHGVFANVGSTWTIDGEVPHFVIAANRARLEGQFRLTELGGSRGATDGGEANFLFLRLTELDSVGSAEVVDRLPPKATGVLRDQVGTWRSLLAGEGSHKSSTKVSSKGPATRQ